ncbi:20694_t:CDS:2 [Cetraspora pellucida]|uniref:20694_t:CDS:1 n=1 Tax=Cetraspora pellucida TaxID=1433469 RepID=A0A9N9FJT7_9GLOM|nr:20694_t:CDS:2 [Cetraspora pellucida]
MKFYFWEWTGFRRPKEIRLEKLEEKDPWDNDSEDMFDGLIYKNEELNKAEGYYTKEVSDKKDELYTNLCKDETISVIYLTNIVKLFTKVQDESIVIEQLKKFMQTDALDEKEKRKNEEFKIEKEIYMILAKEQVGRNWNNYEEESGDKMYDFGEYMYLLENILVNPEEEKEVETFLVTTYDEFEIDNELKIDYELNKEEPTTIAILGKEPLDLYNNEKYIAEPYKKKQDEVLCFVKEDETVLEKEPNDM